MAHEGRVIVNEHGVPVSCRHMINGISRWYSDCVAIHTLHLFKTFSVPYTSIRVDEECEYTRIICSAYS